MAADDTRGYPLCLRFFAEARALGVTDVVISPGSRNTPLVLSAKAVGLRCHVQIDERVAAFFALGMAKATGRPPVLVCSSGTAGAHYGPVVVEAHHGSVPLVVCTADRPPELRGWGAGQTVDQRGFYGSSTRWSYELPVASEADERLGRSVAVRAVAAATGPTPGPVHLNWPFRKPLEPSGPLSVPAPTVSAGVTTRPIPRPHPLLAQLAADYSRGVVVAGPADHSLEEVRAIVGFAAAAGWPVVADPASQLRSVAGDHADPVITTGELLFASDRLHGLVGDIDVVVRVGLAPTSKACRLWLDRYPPREMVVVDPGTDWVDPGSGLTGAVTAPVVEAFAVEGPGRGSAGEWPALWRRLEATARPIADRRCAADPGDLGLAAATLAAVPAGGTLVVASSLPIRSVELALGVGASPSRVFANRGANGIDGTIATAAGVAAAIDGPVVALVGDVAAVHDLGGLAGAVRAGVDLVVVVSDNDGGAIFSFLPLADAVDDDDFRTLFATPHDTDLVAVAAALGASAEAVGVADLARAVEAGVAAGGVAVVSVGTAEHAVVEAHAALRRQVHDALGDLTS